MLYCTEPAGSPPTQKKDQIPSFVHSVVNSTPPTRETIRFCVGGV